MVMGLKELLRSLMKNMLVPKIAGGEIRISMTFQVACDLE